VLNGSGFKNMNNRLIFWFLVVSLIPLIIMTGLTYNQRIKSMRMEAESKLEAVRTQKKIQIEQWIDQTVDQISFLANTALEEDFDNEGLALLRKVFFSFAKSETDIKNITLMDNKGEVLLSTGLHKKGSNLEDTKIFSIPRTNTELYISEVQRTPSGNVQLTLSKPFYSETGDLRAEIKGIVSMSLNLDRSIFISLYDRTGLGNTGEAYITDSSGKNISSLLWESDTSPSHILDTEAVKNALEGSSGSIRNMDYRGQEVLAAYTDIPETGWALVVKQDLIEVDTPIYSMLHLILIIFSFSVSGTCILAIFISRSISRPISRITEVAKKIDQGELNSRNNVDRVDELGILAGSINAMADSLLSLIRTQDGITGIISTAVTHEGTKDFAKALIKKLVSITESGMGAFYLYSPEKKTFKHLVATGMNPETSNKEIHIRTLEKEFGSPFIQKNIAFITDINTDTVFSFKTASGNSIPAEIVCIPLVIEKETRGILILASVWQYSEEHRNMIKLSANSINTSFSNIISNERTNLIAEELSSKNRELRLQSEKLKTQSGELRSQSEKLIEQNIELEYQRKQVVEANRLKSEFLSNMSHELRTPLNSILALSRVMKMQAINKLTSEEAKYLEVIERNGKQLLALINDILDLSKIEAGKVEVSPETFSIKQDIEEIAESMIPMIAEKDVDLKIDIQEDLPDIETDQEKTSKIITNLLSNAVKFTNEGMVTVKAFSDGSFITIEVEDTGIGISETELPFIFDEFRQVDGTSSRQFEGTGLGLAICKRTAQMLGGSISVKSTEGKGSIFTVELPLKWNGIGKVVNRLRFKPKPAVPFNPNKGKKILVVDDDFKARTIISEYLSKEGYEVISADSGDKALKMAYLYQPYAITLDLIMPDMDGWEVLQKLKEDSRTSTIPVIIVSVSDEKETGFALGAMSFITKPVESRTLIREINKAGGENATKVMITSTDPDERKNMEDNLLQQGFNTIAAKDGDSCLSLLEKDKPDILVLELVMPGMDGFNIIDQIRNNSVLQDLPIIALTGKDLSSMERNRLSDRAVSVLTKDDNSVVDVAKEVKSLLEQYDQREKEENGLPAAKAGRTSKRILLVEDNEIAALQVKMVLEQEGFLVDSVTGGEQAIDYLDDSIPEGIILDLMMPGMDGFEVLNNIRHRKETHDIPVLVLTAKDLSQEDFEKLSMNNIQQLIHKGNIDRDGLLQMARLVFMGEQWIPDIPEKKPVIDRKKTPESAEKKDTFNNVRREGPQRALIVEDNPDNLFTLKTLMGKTYEYIEAFDGEKGLELAKKELPDIILLDISIPKLDGYEVARRLKEDEKTRNIPIIAVTARAMKGEREKTLACGCDDYISKPVDQEILEKKLSLWLKVQTN